MRLQVLLILPMIFKWFVCSGSIYYNEDGRNLPFSVTDHFFIQGINDIQTYIVYVSSARYWCRVKYGHSVVSIYSLFALRMNPESEACQFVQIAYNKGSNRTLLSLITLNLTNCQPGVISTKIDTTLWEGDRQKYTLLKIDPQEKYAYILTDSLIFSYDLSTNQLGNFQLNNVTFRKSLEYEYVPYAFDVSNEWAVIVGYSVVDILSLNCITAWFLELPALALKRRIDITPYSFFSGSVSDISVYNFHYGLSISIDPSGTLIALGVFKDGIVKIFPALRNLDMNTDLYFETCNFGNGEKGFGRSVTWLDNHGSLAVLVDRSKLRIWPLLEIHVYSNISTTTAIYDRHPDFILPNNQQTFFEPGANVKRASKNFEQSLEASMSDIFFSHIVARPNSLSVVPSDFREFIYIYLGDPGFRTVLTTDHSFVFKLMEPRPCPSGTYKDKPDFGPCTICPTGTKNPGGSPSIQCQRCNSTLFCPLGASGEVHLDDFQSYNQTWMYPQSPLIDDYDDLLIRNFFTIETDPKCIVISPFFWSLVGMTISFLLWLALYRIKSRQSPGLSTRRTRVKTLLKRVDFIGEGERLVGGLASLVILTITIHSFWFGNDYLHSYPIENINPARLACKNDAINTKFTNALQLPLPKSNGNTLRIFGMLDQQKFRMKVDLINTAACCDRITVQRIKHMGLPRNISLIDCTVPDHHPTNSFSFDLLSHTDTVQVTVMAPNSIGALRLCLSGPSDRQYDLNEVHELKTFDVCTLFYTDNQTIGLSTDFTVHLIKTVNITEPLDANDDTKYEGRWASYITYAGDLSDEHYFEKDGQYLRYVSSGTTFTIRHAEPLYFIENNQSPIIRRYELIFHTFLFVFVIIDIVAMIFVVYKLWCQPFLRWLLVIRADLPDCVYQLNHRNLVINVSEVNHFPIF